MSKRDAELAAVARMKAVSPGIGDPLFLPRERIERAERLPVRIGRDDDELHLLWTTAENALGARKNGRILVASSPEAHYLYGGAFFIEEYGRRCVHSIWVEPEYRGAFAMTIRGGTQDGTLFRVPDLIGRMLRDAGVRCVLPPISKAGKGWARRQGLRVVR